MESKHIYFPKNAKWLYRGFMVLMANAGILAAFSHENFLYYANVLLHILLGIILIGPFVVWARRFLKTDAHYGKPFGHNAGRLGYLMMILATAAGLYLIVAGNVPENRWASNVHIAAGILACLFMISSIRRAGYNISVSNIYSYAGRWGLVMFILSGMLPIFTHMQRAVFPSQDNVIFNSVVPPASMADAALGGADGPFYPSPAETKSKRIVEHDFLETPELCGQAGCHPDIYAQWQQSQHQGSSLGGNRYKQAVSLVQERDGLQQSNYCAGCHSPALLFSGNAAKPVAEITDTVAANSGVTCTACHAISKVKNTTGNGSYIIKRPATTWMALSENSAIRQTYQFLLRSAPESHRKAFLRPFMRKQTDDFCSTCHKMNFESKDGSKRWLAGLGEYSSWRKLTSPRTSLLSFYDVPNQKTCLSCHMPLVASQDAGNRDGKVHDHRFMARAATDGEDGQQFSDAATAPVMLDLFISQQRGTGGDAGKAGKSLYLEFILRAEVAGHFVSFGVFENKVTWLAVEAFDADGKRFFQADILGDGAQPDMTDATSTGHNGGFVKVEKDALQRIPVGTALLKRLQMPVPENIRGPLNVRARLLTKELRWHMPHFTVGDTGATDGITAGFHDPRGNGMTAGSITAGEAAEVLAHLGRQIDVADTAQASLVGMPVGADEQAAPVQRERWNAYGAGLFASGEFDRAAAAFARARQYDPVHVTTQINLARTYIQLARSDSAKVILRKILQDDSKNARAQFYLGLIFKNEKQYSEALKHLRKARRYAPGDVVVWNVIGYVRYMKNDYKGAIRALRRVVLLDPENIPAHYYRMLSYRKMGHEDRAAEEERLVRRFFPNLEIEYDHTSDPLFNLGKPLPIYPHFPAVNPAESE